MTLPRQYPAASQVRLIFSGGGDENDSRPLDEQFAKWIKGDECEPPGRVLYLPTALVDTPSMISGIEWFGAVYTPLGLPDFEAWTDLSNRQPGEIEAFAAIYIGGGNTFYLLDQLRRHGLVEPIRQAALNGVPIYGGSAGAIILSKDITPCAHIDPDIVGLTDRFGLDLALGWAIWCHFTPGDEDRIRAYVLETGTPSAACSERTGVLRIGEHLVAGGYDPVIVFSSEGERSVNPGETII